MSSSATPQAGEPSSHRRSIPSRPTTPLRPTSRSSFRNSNQHDASHRSSTGRGSDSTPLEALEPAFAELSDGMADLEANMMHLQLMHESLARFSESFAAFLYGLNMNAFCVDFPEAPLPESFRRQQLQDQAREAVARMSNFGVGGAASSSAAASRVRGGDGNEADTEATFM
ncbi:putative dash complex component [Diplodia seriata]|uniref:DASH complex subunit DAM1 n=1 Tax=Diplodia seriata TaxID=420778 RepID=A0A0G2EB11_9PEZI|nr:putative dash complex component [Diplodia seriata]